MWYEKKSPFRIERRFEFENYQLSSNFLEKIERISKKNKIFPNISFGAKFASLTIFIDSDSIPLEVKNFMNEVDSNYQNNNS